MPVTPKRARELALAQDNASSYPHFDKIAFRTPRRTFATLGLNSDLNLNSNFGACRSRSVVCFMTRSKVWPLDKGRAEQRRGVVERSCSSPCCWTPCRTGRLIVRHDGLQVGGSRVMTPDRSVPFPDSQTSRRNELRLRARARAGTERFAMRGKSPLVRWGLE